MDYDCIAYDIREDVNIVKSIIEDFNLFTIKKDIISSKSVQNRLDKRDEKSAKARESANARWNKDNANAKQTQSERNAIKESKVKEIKLKENKDIVVAFKNATLQDYIIKNINKEYFINNYNSDEKHITKELREFYLYWSEKKVN